jgi:hypothetical protein
MVLTRYLLQRSTTKIKLLSENHSIQRNVRLINKSSTKLVSKHVILQNNTRLFSNTAISPNDLVSTKLNPDLGIAEITMHNGSVNSLSLEM